MAHRPGERRRPGRILAKREIDLPRPRDLEVTYSDAFSHIVHDLRERIGRAIEASPAKEIEKNVKALLQGGLAKLDVVPRAEFDVQAKVLARTREKLEALERKVAELEARQSGG